MFDNQALVHRPKSSIQNRQTQSQNTTTSRFQIRRQHGSSILPIFDVSFRKILEAVWEREGIQKVEFMRESNKTYHEGKIFRHNVRKCRKSTSPVFSIVDNTIYVYDTAVLFTSR